MTNEEIKNIALEYVQNSLSAYEPTFNEDETLAYVRVDNGFSIYTVEVNLETQETRTIKEA